VKSNLHLFVCVSLFFLVNNITDEKKINQNKQTTKKKTKTVKSMSSPAVKQQEESKAVFELQKRIPDSTDLDMSIGDSDLVEVTVGGKLFTATRRTLTKQQWALSHALQIKCEFTADCFDNPPPSQKLEIRQAKKINIEGEPIVFEYMLRHFRSGQCFRYPPGLTKEEVDFELHSLGVIVDPEDATLVPLPSD